MVPSFMDNSFLSTCRVNQNKHFNVSYQNERNNEIHNVFDPLWGNGSEKWKMSENGKVLSEKTHDTWNELFLKAL